MNVFKRATCSVTRKVWKNVLFVFAVFIVATAVVGAVFIERAFIRVEYGLRQQMRPVLSISRPSHYTFMGYSVMTPEIVRAIGELPQVSVYDYTQLVSLESFELRRHNAEQRGIIQATEMPEFLNVLGASQPDFFQLKTGEIDLVAGRTFLDVELNPNIEEEISHALISEALALDNDLWVGSTFSMHRHVFVPGSVTGFLTADAYREENIYEIVSVEFRVIGIYDIPEGDLAHSELQGTNQAYVRTERDLLLDHIFVPNWVIEKMSFEVTSAHRSAQNLSDEEMPHFMTSVIPIFLLGDPAYMEDFKELAGSLLPEHYTFVDLSSAFDEIETSMKQFLELANFILFATIGASVVLMGLLTILFLSDRRSEIGIYLALGEKKKNIVKQLLLEVTVVVALTLLASVFAGNALSDVVSRGLLRREIVAQQQHREEYRVFEGEWTTLDQIGIPTPRITPEELLDFFDLSLRATDTIVLYAIGLGVVMTSASVPIFWIARLNPKKVLLG